MSDNTKPGQVVFSCPTCGKKYRAADQVNQYQGVTASKDAQGNIQMILAPPQIICLGCGVMFFTPNVCSVIKKQQQEGQGQIMTPDKKIVLVH